MENMNEEFMDQDMDNQVEDQTQEEELEEGHVEENMTDYAQAGDDEDAAKEEEKVTLSQDEFNKMKMYERLLNKRQADELEVKEKAQVQTKEQIEDKLFQQAKQQFPQYDDESIKAYMDMSKLMVGNLAGDHIDNLKFQQAEASMTNFIQQGGVNDEDAGVLRNAYATNPEIRDLIVDGKVTASDMYDIMDAPRLRKELADLKVQVGNKKNQKAGHANTGSKPTVAKKTMKEPSLEQMQSMSDSEFQEYQKSMGVY